MNYQDAQPIQYIAFILDDEWWFQIQMSKLLTSKILGVRDKDI